MLVNMRIDLPADVTFRGGLLRPRQSAPSPLLS